MSENMETKHIGAVHYSDLKEGDTISFKSEHYFSVYRPVSPKPKPGTRGTGMVDGERIPGIINEDGDFKYLLWSEESEYVDDFYKAMDDSLEFEPDENF